MSEYVDFAILFGVGLFAGVINVMAGGGSTLTLPVLIFLGLEPVTANGTNRVAIIIQNIFATLSFRQKKVSQFRQSLTFALWTIPGAIIGTLVAVRISDQWFQIILGMVMMGIVISMLIPRPVREATDRGVQSKWIFPILLGIGFYGGFIQAGIGFLFMAAFYHLLQMNLVFVNLHKVVVILMYTLPALLIFALSGHVDWLLGLSLASGNALGAWYAAQLMVVRGEKVVRYMFMVAIAVMAAKLLGVF